MPVHNYLTFYIVRDDEKEDKKSVTVERILHIRRNGIHIIRQFNEQQE